MNAEALLAGLGLVACAVVALRMALGPPRRARMDVWLRGRWMRLRRGTRGAVQQRHAQADASREAQALIERARGHGGRGGGSRRVEREGNVYRPRAFGPREGPPADGRQRRDH